MSNSNEVAELQDILRLQKGLQDHHRYQAAHYGSFRG
jgi:hypothetical protein